MDEPSPETAVRDAIRHWSRMSDLVEFAVLHQGFGHSDGGFGVTYSGDLDEYDRVVERLHVPEGYVEIYGHWGPPGGYSLLIRESFYLTVLAGMLAEAGLVAEAERIRGIQEGAADA